ncbi:hypothetical protein BGY98DRAFT_336832 [Russula aff. rugulosa BPL654]|nr:hypothetical protein BGY98DRAFT_336832 [Russula aff. rugulosa BPL654]
MIPLILLLIRSGVTRLVALVVGRGIFHNGSLHVLGIDIHKKWMCRMCRNLTSPPLLFRQPLNMCSTMLVRSAYQRLRRCQHCQGYRTRRGASSTTNLLELSFPPWKGAAATSTRKHAKLRELTPGGCGTAPPPPTPALSVSPRVRWGSATQTKPVVVHRARRW